jgi:hypothetical protein
MTLLWFNVPGLLFHLLNCHTAGKSAAVENSLIIPQGMCFHKDILYLLVCTITFDVLCVRETERKRERERTARVLNSLGVLHQLQDLK